MPGLWAGCGLSLLSPGCGHDFIWLVCLLACMRGLVFGLYLLCPGCGRDFVWLGLSIGLYVGSGFGLYLLCPRCGLGFIWLVCLSASCGFVSG